MKTKLSELVKQKKLEKEDIVLLANYLISEKDNFTRDDIYSVDTFNVDYDNTDSGIKINSFSYDKSLITKEMAEGLRITNDSAYQMSKLFIQVLRYVNIESKEALNIAYKIFIASSKASFNYDDLKGIIDKNFYANDLEPYKACEYFGKNYIVYEDKKNDKYILKQVNRDNVDVVIQRFGKDFYNKKPLYEHALTKDEYERYKKDGHLFEYFVNKLKNKLIGKEYSSDEIILEKNEVKNDCRSVKIPAKLVRTYKNKKGVNFSVVYLPEKCFLKSEKGNIDIGGFCFTTFPAKQTENKHYVEITMSKSFTFTLEPRRELIESLKNEPPIKLTGKHLLSIFEEQNEIYNKEKNYDFSFPLNKRFVENDKNGNIIIEMPKGICPTIGSGEKIDLSGKKLIVPQSYLIVEEASKDYYTIKLSDKYKVNVEGKEITGFDLIKNIREGLNKYLKTNEIVKE